MHGSDRGVRRLCSSSRFTSILVVAFGVLLPGCGGGGGKSKKPGQPGGTPGAIPRISMAQDHGTKWTGSEGDLPAPVSGPIVADPVTPGVRFAWTGLGLYKTLNGGIHWQKLGLNLPKGAYVENIAIAPTNPNRIYVSTYGASVQCSADAGNTWAQCSNGLYGSSRPGSDSNHVEAMAVSPKNELVAYTTTWRGYLFMTMDGGDTWSPIADSNPEWGNTQIYIAPSNPNVLYASNDQFDFEFGIRDVTVLKSVDGGSTWNDVGQPNGYPSDVAQLQILRSDPNTVYATTTQGLYVTTNGGRTWNAVIAPTPKE